MSSEAARFDTAKCPGRAPGFSCAEVELRCSGGRSGKLSLKLDCALQKGDELLVAHAGRRQVASQHRKPCAYRVLGAGCFFG